jgi:hypothetical protein
VRLRRWDLWDGEKDGTFPTGIRQKLHLSGARRAALLARCARAACALRARLRRWKS